MASDGQVIGWGWDWMGQSNLAVVPAQSGVIAIASSGWHSLALTAEGQVIGWGANGSGECDVPADAQSGVTAIAAGASHSLALRSDGQVIAWGWKLA